ncbi:hypothetical protein CROQUDRAFT_108653 [Cronartium quercuum f. sp. fusiforme G11]|uniref:Uncharacterized protein n=1 Tax=Cronartium quercuum f. sp. fusiforme G11 TaxID=708437 RepID=A0A9P6NIF2_9BASI|nr:hypothetical protein CROQUDRAFT_108653 [Cronartium quercuum f. sp. fusiforme G11]
MLGLSRNLSVILSLIVLILPIIHIDAKSTGHFLGKKPTAQWMKANPARKVSKDIQSAECAYNLRVPGQVFAYFQVDPTKARYNGAPYGTCFACAATPTTGQLEDNPGYNVFFWDGKTGQPGPGTGPIKNPKTGANGYENSRGVYFDGKDPTEKQT